MSCGESGKRKNTYTGNQVGDLNYVGDYNYVAGGPPGSGLSAGTTVSQFIPNSKNRSPWKRADAVFNDNLLDACYPVIDLQWFADIQLTPSVTFRISDRSFYIMENDGTSNYYDARCDRAPPISVTVGEWLAPKYQTSDLTLSINNRDGLYNDYLPLGDLYQQWTNAVVNIYIGFGEKKSNYERLFEGKVAISQGLTTTRDTIELKVSDKLETDQIPLPPRSFSSDTFPDINDSQAGKPVPLVYGDWSENVPQYGSVPAYCTNALEEDPETYAFKISDVALESIDSVWLHRGDRTPDKPQGPIRIADNVIDRNEDAGEFSIPSEGVVLDEPYYIGERLKTGVGTSGTVITADNNFNFIEQGVKVGDNIVNQVPVNASLIIENLEFKASQTGANGNNISIEYYLMSPDNSVDQTKCVATLVLSMGVSIIRVGIPQGYDSLSAVVRGASTADAIKSAIYANSSTKALVRINLTGTVPIMGYPPGTKVGKVRQTVPQGPTPLTSGANGSYYQTIIAVTNFSITVDGTTTFSPGDEYNISTVQYKFLDSDKFTVVCQGKPLNIVNVDRLPDITQDLILPEAIKVDNDATMWIPDDSSQKIYNLSFDKKVLRTINYTDIDPSITKISGIDITTDDKLWCIDPVQSKIFRFDLVTEELGLVIYTDDITGITGPIANLSGIAVESSNQFWLSDKATSEFYLIDAFSSVNPFIVRQFNADVSNVNSTEVLDVAIDSLQDALTFVDRTTNSFYRVDKITGELISSFLLTDVADNVAFVTGVSMAQDGTIFFVDQGTLSVYNYNDMDQASTNPAIIARDLIQKFGGHTYDEFDLSWMQTARQLSDFKARLVFDSSAKMIDAINSLLRQYNTAFFLRFNKYSLFFIDFDNFRTTGRGIFEKDIKENTFKPGKETSQYFNSATATYNKNPYTGGESNSDTYVSPAAISFAGSETNRILDLPNVYRRQDLDRLMPLFVKLSVPDPEFINMTLNFRHIRTQMQDFTNLTFDGDINCKTGRKESGRRYSNVPCMIRSIKYDLNFMTVDIKVWSLGNTSFPGYTAQGRTVGGVNEPIVLSNIGRLGRISPVSRISSSTSNSITVSNHYGSTAFAETHPVAGKAWLKDYSVDLVDASTGAILETLVIDSVSGNVITFTSDITATVTPTVLNAAGFVDSGTYLQYSTYSNATIAQRGLFASFTKPTVNYPTSKTQELEEQRGGVHNFSDGGVPYVLYPNGFQQY